VIFKKFNEFYSSTKLYIFSRYLFLILKMLLDDVLYFIRVCIFTAFLKKISVFSMNKVHKFC